MKNFFLGHTANGLPIPGYKFGYQGPLVLILGGVHGDEHEGVEAAHGLLEKWSKSFPFQLQITLVPALNLDGVIRHTRGNGHGVDLNRNMATKDWTGTYTNPRYNPGPYVESEPETRHLARWIQENQPQFILSLHSWLPVLNVNGDCKREALAISRWTGYKISDSIGYPTPGCLGTYCGLERNIPTLTYEIERGLDTQSILRVHVAAIEEGLKVTELTRQNRK